jgi:predicted XRE-type DNA-binding protein
MLIGSFEEAQGDVVMRSEKLKVVRGSGNVFRDLGHKNADAEQFKAILAAEIIKALDRDDPSVRAAHGRTGIAAADFSRIRNADLGRFTVDCLMSIINRLGSRVEVKVRVRRAEIAKHKATLKLRCKRASEPAAEILSEQSELKDLFRSSMKVESPRSCKLRRCASERRWPPRGADICRSRTERSRV